MSDTHIPANPNDQPQEAQNVQEFAPPTPKVQGETDEQPDTQGEPQAEQPKPRSLEERLLGLGQAGRILLDILGTIVDTIESNGKPQLAAGSIGFLLDVSKEPTQVEYACLATQFGNDLLLKGLTATITEQMTAKNVEAQRRAQRAQQTSPMLESLLAALKKSAEETAAEVSGDETSATDDMETTFCDDPECEACKAARSDIEKWDDQLAAGPGPDLPIDN